MTWNPFHYDSNAAWGVIDSPEAWAKLLDNPQHPSRDDRDQRLARTLDAKMAVRLHANTLLETALAGDASMPSFGWRSEHIGDGVTLREWATGNGMIGALT